MKEAEAAATSRGWYRRRGDDELLSWFARDAGGFVHALELAGRGERRDKL